MNMFTIGICSFIVIVVVVWMSFSVFLLEKLTPRSRSIVKRQAADAESFFTSKEIFDRRKKLYDEDKKILERLIVLQAGLVAISIGLSIGSVREYRILDLPAEALLIIVPTVLLYTWGRFGFVFSQLIDNRCSLLALLYPSDNRSEASRDDLRALLRDHGLVDAYFATYYPEYFPETAPLRINRVHLFAYALFMASVNASVIGTLWNASIVWQNQGSKALAVFCLALFCVVLSLTHYQFGLYNKSVNLQMHVIWISSVASVGLALPTLLNQGA